MVTDSIKLICNPSSVLWADAVAIRCACCRQRSPQCIRDVHIVFTNNSNSTDSTA